MNIDVLIGDCQAELSGLVTNLYYTRTYKYTEQTYWTVIPNWIYEDFHKSKAISCLDIGCGYGTLALICKKLLDCNIYCIDLNNTFLSDKLVKKHNFHVQYSNIELEDISFETKFDIVFLTSVLEHFSFHPLPTLKKIRKSLNPEGKMYLSVPNADDKRWGKLKQYFESIDKMPMPSKDIPIVNHDHHYHYQENELVQILDDAGFKVLRNICYFGHFNLTLGVK